MINVIIPMAGLGSRFTDYGFTLNKYLLPINLKLTKMIESAILTLNINENSRYVFIIREDLNIDIIKNTLHEICIKNNFNYDIIVINTLTDGPASTAIIAFEKLNIDLNAELIISNSDQILEWNFDNFSKSCREYDGCVLTYQPNYIPILGTIDKHSFIELDSNNYGIRVTEKEVISNNTLVGVHYFKTGQYFIDGYNYMVKNNIKAPNGEYYISLVYQAMIELGKKIGIHKLGNDEYFHPVGEPIDYFNYLNLSKDYNHNIINISDDYELASFNDTTITYNKYSKNKNIKNNYIKLILNGKVKIDDKYISSGYFTNDNIEIIEESEIITIKSNILCNINEKQIWNRYDYTRGWFIGDFTPSIIKTSMFEVGMLEHKQNEKHGFHYHEHLIEINYLIKGTMILNNTQIFAGQIFTLYKNQIACPKFLEDCTLVCIKIPSVKGDKVII